MNLYAIPENSLLLMQFRQFAGELIEQKKSLETQFPLAPGAIADTSVNAAEAVQMVATMAAEVQRARGALLNVLGGQANRIQELGGQIPRKRIAWWRIRQNVPGRRITWCITWCIAWRISRRRWRRIAWWWRAPPVAAESSGG